MTAAAVDWSGPRRQPCPACDKGPRDTALSVTRRDDGTYIAHCFRCGAVFFSDEPRPRRTAEKPRPVGPRRHEVLSSYGRDLWNASRPVSGPARAYLEARGCAIPPVDGDLRWHPALRHPSGYEGPALVGLVTHAVTREPMSLHRTWIRPDGHKADVDPPRMLLGGHRKSEGVIRLWPDEAVTLGLGIAEGVETALTLANAYKPVWSCIDAGNLAQLPVLNGIETLVIAADHDEAGLKAANSCADRWAAAGVTVYPIAPRAKNLDWNDVKVLS
jgi:hypothetical protein